MKKHLIFATLLASILVLSGCGASSSLTFNPNINQTSVVLSQNNFKVVGTVSAEVTGIYILGFGNITNKALKNNAIAEMMSKANLVGGSRAVINITVKKSVRMFTPLYVEVTMVATGNVVEFTGGSQQPMPNPLTSAESQPRPVTPGKQQAVVSVAADELSDPAVTTPVDGVEWVDMGGSVLWASCNVGADSPEDYGDYFAWGETKTKESYTKSNRLTHGKKIKEWIPGRPNATYDAATANWGGIYRMPTIMEFKELKNDCTWEWTVNNGVKGQMVTSQITGQSIFLPAAGFRSDSSFYNVDTDGNYWCSTPYENGKRFAYDFRFVSSNFNIDWANCVYGRSVRPVKDK